MYIKNRKDKSRQPNEFHAPDGSIRKYRDGYRDSLGRKQTIYDMKKRHEHDYDEMVRSIEESMIRYCDKNHLDWAKVDKLDLAKKMGCSKEYRNALVAARLFT